MNTTIAIYSHHTRSAILDKTVTDLRDVGIEPSVINVQQGNPSQIANRRNAHSALVKAFNGNPVLVLEDDVLPNVNLVQWIEWLERYVDSVTTLYGPVGKFYTPEVRRFVEAGVTVPRHLHGVHTLQGLRGWYGAQGVWIPTSIAEDMIADRLFAIHEHAPYGPWDHAIRRHLIERYGRMLVTVPNVLQHRAPPSVVNRSGKRHTTNIFDLVEKPPEKE